MKTPEHQDNNGPEPLREAPGSATPTWDDCERKYRAMREELGKDMNEYKRRLADYTATLDAWAEAEFSPNAEAHAP